MDMKVYWKIQLLTKSHLFVTFGAKSPYRSVTLCQALNLGQLEPNLTRSYTVHYQLNGTVRHLLFRLYVIYCDGYYTGHYTCHYVGQYWGHYVSHDRAHYIKIIIKHFTSQSVSHYAYKYASSNACHYSYHHACIVC